MFSFKSKVLTTAAAFGLLAAAGTSGVANAQESYMPPPGQGQEQRQYQQPAQDPFGGQQQQQQNVSAGQLEAFIEAEAAAREVQSKFQEQAASVTSPDEMTELQQQVNAEMIEAIKETGMSVDQYNVILAAIQSNPEVRDKYMNMVQ